MIGNIKIIAVCMCKVYDERNYRIIRALNNFAVENDYSCSYITPAQTFIGRLCLKKASSLCLTLLIII